MVYLLRDIFITSLLSGSGLAVGCLNPSWSLVYLLRDIFIMSLLSGSGLAVSVLNLLVGFGLPVEGHFS